MLAKFLNGEWVREDEYKQLLLTLSPPLTEYTLIDAICRGVLAVETRDDLYRGAQVRCLDGREFIENMRARDAAARMSRIAA